MVGRGWLNKDFEGEAVAVDRKVTDVSMDETRWENDRKEQEGLDSVRPIENGWKMGGLDY